MRAVLFQPQAMIVSYLSLFSLRTLFEVPFILIIISDLTLISSIPYPFIRHLPALLSLTVHYQRYGDIVSVGRYCPGRTLS